MLQKNLEYDEFLQSPNTSIYNKYLEINILVVSSLCKKAKN